MEQRHYTSCPLPTGFNHFLPHWSHYPREFQAPLASHFSALPVALWCRRWKVTLLNKLEIVKKYWASRYPIKVHDQSKKIVEGQSKAEFGALVGSAGSASERRRPPNSRTARAQSAATAASTARSHCVLAPNWTSYKVAFSLNFCLFRCRISCWWSIFDPKCFMVFIRPLLFTAFNKSSNIFVIILSSGSTFSSQHHGR